MGIEIPEGYGQATLRFACTGVIDPMVVTWGYDATSSALTPASAATHANDAMTLLTSTTAKLLHGSKFTSEYTVLGCTVSENQDGEMVQGISTVPSVPGTIGSTPSLPPNCAFLVRKGTGLGGRRGRGRMYFPPLFQGEAFVAASGQITGSLTTMQTGLNQWLADYTTAGTPMVLFHGYRLDDEGNVIPGQTLPVPTPITSLTVQNLIATQRRRMR